MTDQATFIVSMEDRIPVVSVAGEIDLVNVDQFKDAVKDAAVSEAPGLVLVLERVSYLDSHTIEAIVDVARHLRTNRRRLVLVAPEDGPAGRILHVAGVDLAIDITASIGSALDLVRTER